MSLKWRVAGRSSHSVPAELLSIPRVLRTAVGAARVGRRSASSYPFPALDTRTIPFPSAQDVVLDPDRWFQPDPFGPGSDPDLTTDRSTTADPAGTRPRTDHQAKPHSHGLRVRIAGRERFHCYPKKHALHKPATVMRRGADVPRQRRADGMVLLRPELPIRSTS